jgi:hypothetical protein
LQRYFVTYPILGSCHENNRPLFLVHSDTHTDTIEDPDILPEEKEDLESLLLEWRQE